MSLERVLAVCTFAPNLGLCLVVGWKFCAFTVYLTLVGRNTEILE